MNNKYIKALFFIFLVLTTKSPAITQLVDPEFPLLTKLVYQINVPKKKLSFEYYTQVDRLITEEAKYYKVSSYTKPGRLTLDYTNQAIYKKNSFLPISYKYSAVSRRRSFHYYKEINWDHQEKKYSLEIKSLKDGKYENKINQGEWKDDPYLDFALFYNGLFNALPFDPEKEIDIKVFLINTFANIKFKIIGKETIHAAGQDYECYKVEADPDLGILLNFTKFFLGFPKSYLWVTTANPRLLVKGNLTSRFVEGTAILKSAYLSEND